MIDAIRNFLSQNWLGTIIGVLGIIYAIYEAKRRRGPRLAYQFIGARVLESERHALPGGIEVTYNGERLEFLSKTQIIIWNKGDTPVKRSDLTTTDPLRFSFANESSVLLLEVSKVTQESNGSCATLRPDHKNEVSYAFDFLDANDGALITIWHSSREPMPDCYGTVIGQKGGPVSYGRYIPRSRDLVNRRPSNRMERIAFSVGPFIDRVNNGMLGFILVISIFAMTFPLYRRYIPFIPAPEPMSGSSWVTIIMSSINIILVVFLLQSMRRKFPRSLLPDENLAKPSSDGSS